jgi:MYXO-CTERM domain-containing protein
VAAVVWLATAVFIAPRSARANGRYPFSNQILFSTTTADLVVVRTSFGILISHDAGTNWRWLCEDTLGLPPTASEDPSLGLTASNTIVAGLSTGLRVSADVGCNWTWMGGPFASQFIRDVDVHRNDPHTVDVVTSTYGPSANVDGGVGYAQQVYQSTDDGMTWTPQGRPIDPSATVTTIEAAASDPTRIYVTAFRAQSGMRTASLFVSTNQGTTWVEHQAPLDPTNETAIDIAAVDPTNADLVYFRTEPGEGPSGKPLGPSRLVVTSNGGQTFSVADQLRLTGPMPGFALSADGSKVYVGSIEDGLFVGDTSTLTFAKTSCIHVQCLAVHDDGLWACADEPSGFIVGASTDDGRTFTPKMHLLSIQAPLDCPSSSTEAQCLEWSVVNEQPYSPLVNLCTNLSACVDAARPEPLTASCACSGACSGLPDAPLDACAGPSLTGTESPVSGCGDSGASDAGDDSSEADAGGEVRSNAKSGCGCSMAGGGSAPSALAVGGLLGALGLRRRAQPPRGPRRL